MGLVQGIEKYLPEHLPYVSLTMIGTPGVIFKRWLMDGPSVTLGTCTFFFSASKHITGLQGNSYSSQWPPILGHFCAHSNQDGPCHRGSKKKETSQQVRNCIGPPCGMNSYRAVPFLPLRLAAACCWLQCHADL